MDKKDIAEQSYKNGYEAGVKKYAERLKGELKDDAYYSADIVRSVIDQLCKKFTEGKA